MAKKKRRALARRSSVGIQKLMKLERAGLRLKQATAKAREKTSELVDTIVTAGVTGGTGFGLGYWAGRTGKDPAVGPIPADAAIATTCHIIAVLGVGKTAETVLRGVANGALATYAARQGAAMGAKAKTVTPPLSQGWDELDLDDDDDDDDDDEDVEGMALEPGDFAGVEIL